MFGDVLIGFVGSITVILSYRTPICSSRISITDYVLTHILLIALVRVVSCSSMEVLLQVLTDLVASQVQSQPQRAIV